MTTPPPIIYRTFVHRISTSDGSDGCRGEADREVTITIRQLQPTTTSHDQETIRPLFVGGLPEYFSKKENMTFDTTLTISEQQKQLHDIDIESRRKIAEKFIELETEYINESLAADMSDLHSYYVVGNNKWSEAIESNKRRLGNFFIAEIEVESEDGKDASNLATKRSTRIIGGVGVEQHRHLAKKGIYDVAELRRMIIDPKYRGLGIGSKLLQVAEQWCIEQGGYRQLKLDTVSTLAAPRFYLKNGFAMEKKEPYHEEVHYVFLVYFSKNLEVQQQTNPRDVDGSPSFR
eukprot:GEZU01016264.1.p1 GENE.GEZU01016264.1~~GEZU01016264.1.p1  ORF type:complete len:290 (+),score=64.18 GEZU01016264.1:137-1006(+)